MVSSNATYVVELDRWGIKNDGTDALNTTNGINSALVWAMNNDYNECKLPQGFYLIDKDNQIIMVSNMTLILYGCLIKKETNGYQEYATIKVDHQVNASIVGGIVEGDKNTHDYRTVPGTHEWGTGIKIIASKNTKIDSVEIKNTTGYGIAVGSTYDHINWVYRSELESGTFDTNGNPITNSNWVRNNKYYSLTSNLINQRGYFMVCGNGYGSYGTGLDLSKEMITVFFYDKDNKYLGQLTRRTYEPFYKAYFPINATKFKLSFRSKFENISDSTITIRADGFSQFVNISNCYIHDCRTLGVAGIGGQFITIENCEISGIGGAAPGFGIDLEDGYNLNQNIIVRNNHFHDNKNGDIVVISARNVLLEMNKFNGTVSFGGARGENFVSQYNEYNGAQGSGSSLAGGDGTFVVFRYDHFTNSQIYLSGNSIYENSIFDNMSFILQSDNYLLSQFRYCRFNFNKPDEGWSWILRKGSLLFDSCEFNINCKWYYFRSEAHIGDWSKNKLVFKNNKFNTSVSLGESVYEVDELVLDNNTFVGRQNKTNYYGFWAKANKISMSNNNVRDVYFKIEGKGSNSSAVINNNTVLIDKTATITGPDRSEFLRLCLFDKVFFQKNTLNITQATVPIRGFTIYAEKQLFVTENYFNCESGSNARLDLFGALRVNNNNPVPPLVAVIKDNLINNITKREYASFTSQLSKPVLGTDIDIS